MNSTVRAYARFALVAALLLSGVCAHAALSPDEQRCVDLRIRWNDVRSKGGPPQRRDAVKAVLAQYAGGKDVLHAQCFIVKVEQDYRLVAGTTSALQGWGPLIKEIRYNIEAAKAQATPADRCTAMQMFTNAYSRFGGAMPVPGNALKDMVVREHKAVCGAG